MRGLVVEADWEPRDGYELTASEAAADRAPLGNMVWRNPTIRVAERPDPQPSSPHDVLISNRACGICGTDVHMFRPGEGGYLGLPIRTRLPLAIGHEFAGEVIEVGDSVTRVKPGDPVAVEAMINCGTCRACIRGLPSNCERMEDHGFSLDGGTATFSVAHERHCWPLTQLVERYGDDAAYDVGALTEPAAVVYNGMVSRAGGFRPGDSVAVFGCGPIGLAAAGLASALGADRVLAVDPSAAKREIASALGATASLDPSADDAGDWLLQQTGGVGVDMMIDATGAGSTVAPLIEAALAVGGKIVFLGANTEPIRLDTNSLLIRSASAYSSLGHLGGSFPAIIALHAAGRLDLTKMITGRFALAHGVAAMERAAQGRDAKLLIYPQSPDH